MIKVTTALDHCNNSHFSSSVQTLLTLTSTDNLFWMHCDPTVQSTGFAMCLFTEKRCSIIYLHEIFRAVIVLVWIITLLKQAYHFTINSIFSWPVFGSVFTLSEVAWHSTAMVPGQDSNHSGSPFKLLRMSNEIVRLARSNKLPPSGEKNLLIITGNNGFLSSKVVTR